MSECLPGMVQKGGTVAACYVVLTASFPSCRLCMSAIGGRFHGGQSGMRPWRAWRSMIDDGDREGGTMRGCGRRLYVYYLFLDCCRCRCRCRHFSLSLCVYFLISALFSLFFSNRRSSHEHARVLRTGHFAPYSTEKRVQGRPWCTW